MITENESDDLLFRVHYLALNENPNYPAKQLWQLTKDYLEFLNTIESLDEMTKIKIRVVTYGLLEKIVTPRLDDYVNGEIDVLIDELYGEDSPIVKKIYGTEVEKQKLLDTEKIKTLVHSILYLPALLISNLDAKDIELIKEKTEKETLLMALEDKQEKDKKKIEQMTISYIESCEKFSTDKPTNLMLKKISGIEKELWDHQLSNPIFLTHSLNEIKKKINQAKKTETKEFWRGVYKVLDNKLGKAFRDNKVPKSEYKEEYDYEGRKGKKKNSDYNDDEFIDNIEV